MRARTFEIVVAVLVLIMIAVLARTAYVEFHGRSIAVTRSLQATTELGIFFDVVYANAVEEHWAMVDRDGKSEVTYRVSGSAAAVTLRDLPKPRLDVPALYDQLVALGVPETQAGKLAMHGRRPALARPLSTSNSAYAMPAGSPPHIPPGATIAYTLRMSARRGTNLTTHALTFSDLDLRVRHEREIHLDEHRSTADQANALLRFSAVQTNDTRYMRIVQAFTDFGDPQAKKDRSDAYISATRSQALPHAFASSTP